MESVVTKPNPFFRVAVAAAFALTAAVQAHADSKLADLKKRKMELEKRKAQAEAQKAVRQPETTVSDAEGKALLDKQCTQCHELDELDKKPPKSKRAVTDLLSRMVDNGLESDETELRKIAAYLTKTYAKGNDEPSESESGDKPDKSKKPKPTDDE